ncbi:MAG TPA: tripartite tricarboxylate transporter TctB family protein, partial [Candidatus Binatia bacterium]|nr:tripartite tricarboxylate transporter TctB family protein [Candidatus Binatia bacterium]
MTLAALGVAAVYLVLAARLPAGTVEQPGPGLFPLAAGGLMLVAALATGIEARRTPARMPGPWSGSAAARVGSLAVAMSLFCLALPLAGYLPSAFGLGLVTARLFGQGRWL